MNEFLNEYLGALINVLAIFAFAKIILNGKSKINKISLIVLIILMSLLAYTLCLLNITILKSLIIFLIVALLYKIIFKLEVTKSIILGFIQYVVCLFSDILFIIILMPILGKERFYTNIAGKLTGNIIAAISIIIFAFILKKAILKILNIKIKYRLIIFLIITLAFTLSIFYATYEYGTNSVDNFLGILSIGITIVILFYATMQQYKNNQLLLEYDNLLNLIKKYETEIDNQRIISHESKNQLLTIKSKLIDEENTDEIVKYIEEVINDKKKVKHSEYARFKNLPSNGLKGLLYFKLSTAAEKGIKISTNLSSSLANSVISKLDSNEFNQIGKVIGVYLDNAIEAAIESTERYIGIEGYELNGNVMFIISNSFTQNRKLIGRTTKGENHGYGLILASSIINNNDKLESFTEINKNIYTKKLIIKK